MINYSLETQTDNSPTSKGIVKMSYKIISWKRFKSMDKEKRDNLIKTIDDFQQRLERTKEEIKEWKIKP